LKDLKFLMGSDVSEERIHHIELKEFLNKHTITKVNEKIHHMELEEWYRWGLL